MDYELLYAELQSLEKEIGDKLSSLSKTRKNLAKNSENGDIKSVSKDLAQISGLLNECGTAADKYSKLVGGFNVKEYMESGDFAAQIVSECKKLSVDIKGEYPVYEIFPYKVKIDGENQEIYVDRKKTSCVRPAHFAGMIKRSQDRLNKAPFNADAFLNELAYAYDTAVLHKSENGKAVIKESDVLLKDLYNFIVPMQRFRREYDMQSYAFDLSRLYSSDAEQTKDGRRFQFGSSRNASKLIRILDKEGNERLLGTVRFFEAGV
jgi:hypothetical protein